MSVSFCATGALSKETGLSTIVDSAWSTSSVSGQGLRPSPSGTFGRRTSLMSCVPRPVLLLEDVEGLGPEYCNSSPEALAAAASAACSSLYRQRCNSIVSNRFAAIPVAARRSRIQRAGRGIDVDLNRDRVVPFTRLDPSTAPAASQRQSRRHRHHRDDGNMIVWWDASVDANVPTTGDRRTERWACHLPGQTTPGGDGDDEIYCHDDNVKSSRFDGNVPLQERDDIAAYPYCGRHDIETPTAEGSGRERLKPGGIASRPSSLMEAATDVRRRVGREGEASESEHRRLEDCVVASRSARSASVGLQRDVDEVVTMVCRLHSRLSDAACWTRNLQEDTRASRQKVANLIAQIRQLSQATAPATTDSMQQRPLIVPGGTNGRGGVKDDTLEGTSNYSSEEELEPNGGYGDCDSTTRGRGPAVGSGETSERTTSLPASPTSSRHSSCSQVPSRSSSPAVSIRSPGSTSPMSRPGSPMSQGSGCGSMAPMYSPVSLTEADLLLNAASTDGVDCEFDQQNAGGVSASANTDANAGADSDADAGADACGGEKEGTAAMIDASCRIQGVRDSRGIVVHEGGELMVTVSEAIEARSGGNLNLANGDVGDVKKPSSPAASPRHARWAATGAPDGGNGKTGAISDMHKADAKQQPLESCSASKRRGEGRSRSRSPRRRKKPAVDNSGGKEGVGNHVLASKTTSSRNDNNDNNVSISSPCSERGHQRDPTGTEHGSPREPRRRRRRGKGKCHSLRNHDSINNDRKMDPEPRAGSHAASKGETTGAGAVCALDGGAGDTGAWEDRGARPHSSEAPGETEKGTGPDPMEAGHMLQALSDLSTTLRRLNKDPLSPALHDTTSTADRGGEGGVREANAVSSAPCERCLLLAEKVEDLREHTRAQQRLLEHSDKLLGVTTAATAKKHDARRSSAGQEVNSEVDLPVTAYVDDNAERAAACNAVVMHEENGGSRRGVRRPGRVGPQDTREGAGRDMGSGTSVAASEAEVAEAAVAEAAAAEAAAAVADEENEALLAAAEEVWRISEMARDALEVELERKEEAVSKVAETARESKERLAEQGQEITRLKVALQSQEKETEKWKSEAEKSILKEKDARRAMESAKVAAADVLRRSEREGKTLRAEVDNLKEKVAALRTRLAGMQARRQAERELVAKNTREQMPNTANHPDPPPLDEQHQQRQQSRHHPFVAFRRSSHGSNHDSSRMSTRRYSSAPRGVGESSLDGVPESGRRRTNSSPPDIEALAAAAAAAVWDRYGSGIGGRHRAAAHATSLLYEDGDGGNCKEEFRSQPHEALEKAQELPWSPGRQVVRGQDEGHQAETQAAIMGSSLPFRAGADPGTGGARKMSAPVLLRAPPSRRASSSTSPSRSPRQQSSRGAAFASADNSGGRRRMSSARAADERGGDSRVAHAGSQKPERIRASVYDERSAQAAGRADIERVLRRASQSHPPPVPQEQDQTKTASPGSTGSAESNTNSGDDGDKNADSDVDDRGQEEGTGNPMTNVSHPKRGDRDGGNPPSTAGENPSQMDAAIPTPLPSVRPREGRDEGGGGRGGGGGGGGWRWLLKAALHRKEQEAGVDADDACEPRKPSGEAKGQSPGGRGGGDNGGGTGREKSEHGGYDGGAGEQPVIDDIPREKRQQCGPQVCSSVLQKSDDASASANEKHVRLDEKEESPVLSLSHRPPSPEFWESVEEAGLSTAELEDVIEDITEEEAERLLREKGMLDAAGNLGT